MHLAFSASFSGSQLDTSVWSTCYPWFPSGGGCTNFGNPQEEEWYQPSQDEVSGGALHLVAIASPTSGTDPSGNPKTYAYTSGMVTTDPSFTFTYGYVQIVAQIPGGAGTWPALWMLPTSQAWPPEIDIMENGGSPNTELTTFHWGTSEDPQQQSTNVTSPTDLTVGWHTYGLAWAPGSLTWYLDGKVVDTYTGSNVPSEPMYLLADLAIDGPAASGASFNIQSVQVWQY
jgi:beta-glucanase (GH16 family)